MKITTFAVMKEGRKSAVKVFDSEEVAEAFSYIKGNGFYVVKREGTGPAEHEGR